MSVLCRKFSPNITQNNRNNAMLIEGIGDMHLNSSSVWGGRRTYRKSKKNKINRRKVRKNKKNSKRKNSKRKN